MKKLLASTLLLAALCPAFATGQGGTPPTGPRKFVCNATPASYLDAQGSSHNASVGTVIWVPPIQSYEPDDHWDED